MAPIPLHVPTIWTKQTTDSMKTLHAGQCIPNDWSNPGNEQLRLCNKWRSHSHRLSLLLFFILSAKAAATPAQQAPGKLLLEVRSQSRPVEQAEISAAGQVVLTDARGEAALDVPPGDIELTIARYGFTSRTIRATVSEGIPTRLTVELESESVLQQEITVTATRTETRIEDQPLRVEVLDQEEVEEKTLMTPGDIAMLLNETSGLRVQVTAPSLGAANIRVQGLRGRGGQTHSPGRKHATTGAVVRAEHETEDG